MPEPEPIVLRFAFEVVGVCEAADLAAELRTLGRGSVQVRPVASRFPSAVRWAVLLTTPAAPLRLDVLQALEGEMRDVAQRRPGRLLAQVTQTSARRQAAISRRA
jgi:hypothetical protein